MTMRKALHSRNEIDKLHKSRKEGRRGTTSIKDSIDISIRLEYYIKNIKKSAYSE